MSEATKAAQGPYRLTDEAASGDVIGCREILDASGEVIAATAGMWPDDEDFATARLMAASWAMREALDPDTLNAIANEIDCWEHSSRARRLRILAAKARAALKAANGE